MAIDKMTPSTPGLVKTGNPSGISEQRETEINNLGEITRNALAPNYGEKAEYLVLGATLAVYDQGHAAKPWPQILDFIVATVRGSVDPYGEALCGACERTFVLNAIAQKLVPGDYKPPPKAN